MGLLMVAQRPLREPQWQTSVQTLPCFAPRNGPTNGRKHCVGLRGWQDGRVANEICHRSTDVEVFRP